MSPLRWFGKYSFGLYVWHPIIGVILLHSHVALVSEGFGKGRRPAGRLATLGLDLAVAWVSFNLWEKRFLDLKRYFASGAPKRSPHVATAGIEPGGSTGQAQASRLIHLAATLRGLAYAPNWPEPASALQDVLCAAARSETSRSSFEKRWLDGQRDGLFSPHSDAMKFSMDDIGSGFEPRRLPRFATEQLARRITLT